MMSRRTEDLAKPEEGVTPEPQPVELKLSPVGLIMRHFHFAHLPEDLQAVSQPFHGKAHFIISLGTRGPETTTCLRKLLEAKDCAVRAALHEKEKPDAQD